MSTTVGIMYLARFIARLGSLMSTQIRTSFGDFDFSATTIGGTESVGPSTSAIKPFAFIIASSFSTSFLTWKGVWLLGLGRCAK